MTTKRILVPFDFTSYSELALRAGFELAQQLEADLHLVHVQEGAHQADVYRSYMEKLVAVVLPSQEFQTQVHREILFGIPHEELVKYADKHRVDFIVMGTRVRTGLAQLALGSTAQRVLKSASCPVMMINPEMQKSGAVADAADVAYVDFKTSNSPALDLVARAISLRATDIHIDPDEPDLYRIRMRIDGIIAPYCSLDRSVAEHLIHQCLTLAKVDHADPFRPREGRLLLPATMADYEVRITASPVTGGEAIALRLIAKDKVFMPLDRLGLSSRELSDVQRMLHGSEGLVLITGPTGSGKTTTVYSMLETFGGQHHNIVSIEDPAEFSVPFVRQLNVDERHGVTLTSGLRTVLRMDPDIIFVGEIRDPEAAAIALRAASSGRFVFSTLHTRDVASTITALRDLQASNYSLSGNLVGIVNQRLVRSLCPHCKKSVPPDDKHRSVFAEYELELPSEVCEQVGCSKCRGTGFLGRCGVFETAVCEGAINEAIAADAAESEIRRAIRAQGSASLTTNAICKVRDQVTSLAEALSVRWL